MITQFLFNVLIMIATYTFGFLPRVDELPLGMDNALSTGVGWVNSLILVFWPAQIILSCVVAYILWRLVLLSTKFVMGSRTPVN